MWWLIKFLYWFWYTCATAIFITAATIIFLTMLHEFNGITSQSYWYFISQENPNYIYVNIFLFRSTISDIILETEDGKDLYCHKCVLVARLGKFLALPYLIVGGWVSGGIVWWGGDFFPDLFRFFPWFV